MIQVDFSESHNFAIAGLHCATLELVRDQEDELRASQIDVLDRLYPPAS